MTAIADQRQLRAGQNVVALSGRLAAAAEVKELPSGDPVLTWRLIVPRDSPRSSVATVDTIDCSSFDGRIIKRGAGWAEGSWLQVEGQLRRRFWKSPGGPRSRYEVEVSAARLVKSPAAPG